MRIGKASVWIVAAYLTIFATVGLAQEIHYLALEGEGTASIALDEAAKFAVIHDGGWNGTAGVLGATIRGQHVLDYLRSKKITRLVISCSHPDADHMNGLKELVRDPGIRDFQVSFIDNGQRSKANPRLLYEIYAEAFGIPPADVQYVQAVHQNAFAGLSSPLLRVSNFDYDPALTGDDPHDRALILQYEVGSDSSRRTVIDFDDASSRLVALWATQPTAKANVLVLPHHGSRYNTITPIVADPERYGLTDVIIPVNRSNRYRHPAPDVLLTLLETVGADHIFVTDSDVDRNVTLDAKGQMSAETRARGRGQLLALVEARLRQRRAAASRLISNAASGDRYATRLAAVEKDIRDLSAAKDKIAGSERYREGRPVVLLSTPKGPTSSGPETAANGGPPEGPWPGTGGAPGPAATARDGLSPRPAPGGGYGTYFDVLARGSYPGGGGGGGGMYEYFRTEAYPSWGGIILGATPRGPAVQALAFTVEPVHGEEANEIPPTFTMRFTLADGNVADYAGVTALELWAAYNFVSPTETLLESLGGRHLPPNSAGLIGMQSINEETGEWRFAIHPAIANSRLAQDGMRLDIFLSAAQSIDGYFFKLPEYLREIPVDQAKFDTYQWYDEPATISARGSQIDLSASSGEPSCLMRVRLVRRDQPNDDLSFNEHLKTLCSVHGPLASIDRLARVIALLNWRRGEYPLPSLPNEVRFPESMEVEPRWMSMDVFGEMAKPRIWVAVVTLVIILVLVVGVFIGIFLGLRRVVRSFRARPA